MQFDGENSKKIKNLWPELREIWQRKTDGHTVDILKCPRSTG